MDLVILILSDCQLKKEGRRNEYEMHKLLALNQRQKMVSLWLITSFCGLGCWLFLLFMCSFQVLQRKTEEAAMAAKRLKEVLESRKASSRETTGQETYWWVLQFSYFVSPLITVTLFLMYRCAWSWNSGTLKFVDYTQESNWFLNLDYCSMLLNITIYRLLFVLWYYWIWIIFPCLLMSGKSWCFGNF